MASPGRSDLTAAPHAIAVDTVPDRKLTLLHRVVRRHDPHLPRIRIRVQTQNGSPRQKIDIDFHTGSTHFPRDGVLTFLPYMNQNVRSAFVPFRIRNWPVDIREG
jgi:hypothetical protein